MSHVYNLCHMSLWCFINFLRVAVTILCDCHHHLVEFNLKDFIEMIHYILRFPLPQSLFKISKLKYIVSIMKSLSTVCLLK